MRVVVAEDVVLLREGIVRVLRDGGFEVVGAVGDAGSLLALVEREPVDVAIVDIRMPPTHTDEGLVAAEQLLARDPAVPVVVLSQHVEPAHAVRLLADGRGGVGYLLKERVATMDDLLDAVGRVARGGTAVDPAVVAALVGRRRARDPLDDAHTAGARGARADGGGPLQPGDRVTPRSSGTRRSRRMSPTSCPSSGWRRRRTIIGACWQCSAGCAAPDARARVSERFGWSVEGVGGALRRGGWQPPPRAGRRR